MDRRRFLSLSVLAGLVSGVTLSERKLFAQSMPATAQPYTGRFFLFVNAGGGWDPTMVCDPKGGEVNRLFMSATPADFTRVNGIPVAPVTYASEGGFTNQQFFDRFSDKILVLNGVDMQTNNHDSGNRYTWSGKLEDGYPPLAALIAASLAPGSPLGFLSNGGYENTQGVVPLTRVNDLGTISRIAFPNRPDPTRMDSRYLSDATRARIQQAQNARLGALATAQTLPLYQASMRQLLGTRGGGNLLERLMMFLPTNDALNRSNNPIYRQGLVALAAYQAGVTAAANLDTGGFDTHGDHDNNQSNALGRLLKGVFDLWAEVERVGLQDRVTIMIGSDFGRTPFYNQGRGKDHWSVTSMMMIGAPRTGVIGASDDRFRARGINPTTLEVDDNSQVRLDPKSVHASLRRMAGIDQSEFARQFPLYAQNNINLFA